MLEAYFELHALILIAGFIAIPAIETLNSMGINVVRADDIMYRQPGWLLANLEPL